MSAYLSTATDHELSEWSNVIDEYIHQTQLLTESNQHKQTTGMKGNTVRLFLELLTQVKRAIG